MGLEKVIMCVAQHVAVESIIFLFSLFPSTGLPPPLISSRHELSSSPPVDAFYLLALALSLGKDLVYKQIKSSTCLLVNLDKSFYPFFLACKDFLFSYFEWL